MKTTKLTPEQKQANKEARKEARKQASDLARIEQEKNQKPVKTMTITIEWKKSRTWGANPHLSAEIKHVDGTYSRIDGITASGCGYCKGSTVLAELFNQTLKYKLWQLSNEQIKGGHGSGDSGNAPYGINSYNPMHRSFAGGIGVNCYYKIAEYIGGKFEQVANGKTFDVYKYNDNN